MDIDVPLMAAMNVNTVRFPIDPGVDDPGTCGLHVLDELYRHDMMAIITVGDGIADPARIQAAVSSLSRPSRGLDVEPW